jgi:hypothetical protein
MYNTFHPHVERISHVSQREMRNDPASTTNLAVVKMIVAQIEDTNPVVGLVAGNIYN